MPSLPRNLQRLLTMALILAGISVLTVPKSVRSQQDEAQHIYQLARALHADNIDQQNYTYWVNGNIGKDIGLPAPILTTGQPMVAFTFSALDGSNPLGSDKLKPPYLLNFWASWCPPCRQEFPLLLEASNSQQLSFPIYFVNTLDQQTPALAVLKELKIDRTVYADAADSKFTQSNLQQVVPQTFLIDAKGNIQALHVGNMTPVSIRFFAEVATHPGVGAFDANNPDQMPAAPTTDQF